MDLNIANVDFDKIRDDLVNYSNNVARYKIKENYLIHKHVLSEIIGPFVKEVVKILIELKILVKVSEDEAYDAIKLPPIFKKFRKGNIASHYCHATGKIASHYCYAIVLEKLNFDDSQLSAPGIE